MHRLAYCLSLAFLLPQAAAALGLGELKKHSELNQPFHATIDLVDANAEELDTLRVKLADAERFRRAGIERPHVLSQLRFEVVETGSGPDHIKITSQSPIQEPYLSFLIEVSWSNGRLYREYAALLDPPVYDRATQRTTPPRGRAPDVARPAASGTRRLSSSSAARAAMASPGSYGPTVRGDTLWEIALRARSDSSLTVQQVMMALLRANPDAFFQNNINALKAGAVLSIPDASVIAAVPRSEAVALTSGHWALWEQYRGRVAGATGRAPIGQVASTGEIGDRAISPGSGAAADSELKLLAANTVGTGGVRSDAGGDPGKLRKELDVAQEALTSQKQEIGELSSKLAESDEIIKLLRRQIDVKDAELATLQARAAAPSAAGRPEAAPGATPPAGVPETGTPAAETGAAISDVPAAAAESPPETASPQGVDLAPPEAASQGLGDEAPAGAPLGTGTPDSGTDGAGPGPGQVPDTDPTVGAVADSASANQAPPVGASPDSSTAGLPEASPTVPAETLSVQDGGVLKAIPGGATTLGIAIALILGSVAVAMRRKRAAEVVAPIDDDFPDSEPLPEPWDSSAREGLPLNETMPKGRAAVGETTGPVTVLGIADTVPPVAPEAAIEIEIEEEDPLSDINVYLAYERFDEAEETVKQAIAADPDEHKLKLKLLEVYYAAGNNAAFEQYARVLQSEVEGTGPLWHSALAMWQAMSPERALFAPANRGEPIVATAPSREFVDITSTMADTQGLSPAVGREKSLPAATAGGRALDFDLTGVGPSSTPGRERVVDISTGNELEWDGSGLVVDTARATQGGGALIDLGAGGVGEEKGPEVLDLTVADVPAHSSPDSTVIEPAGVMPSANRSESPQATAERFDTAPGTAATIDFGFGDGPEKQTQDTGSSGALEGTSEVMFDLGLTADEAPTPARVDPLLGGATIDLVASVWPEAVLEAGRASARSTLADDHRFSTAPNREERDRIKEDSVEFDLGDIDLEVVETGPPDPIETATVVDTLEFGGGPRASIPLASIPPASTVDLSLGSRLALDPVALQPGDDGIGADEDTSSELDVKLNLAKAYIELGDAEGARAILQEVTREGTSAERDEAAQLLAQIA
ncbi:MAG: FimV/HubP family polar landmark protein [Gammaproteobacteria bacterium]